MSKHGFTKSRFLSGLQCHKQLWWRVHEPEAPEIEPDAPAQAVFERGRRVGEVARSYVPGGVLIDVPFEHTDERVQATAEALAAGAVAVYEAAFAAGGVFIAADILERSASGWNLLEVKSTVSLKPEHIADVAVQLHVIEAAGLRIERAEVLHINRQCRYPDLSNLFAHADATAEARALLPRVTAEIAAQQAMLDGPLPDIAPGPHCNEPHECPFKQRCRPALPRHHVSKLYKIGREAESMQSKGMLTIHDIPRDYKLSSVAARQRLAVQENRVVVERGLRAALERWKPPFAFLDFESIAPAIPVWNGCRPFDSIPVQFSCHAMQADGSLAHREWLADGPADQRAELVARVFEAVTGANTILAWNSSYEQRCLEGIKACLPDTANMVKDITVRLRDMLPAVRKHVYHPDLGGSFGLKKVLPALVPGMGYHGLEIADGLAAADALEGLLLHGQALPADERARVREALLRYCELDTLALVRLLERLRAMA